jgi:hypothetical protein
MIISKQTYIVVIIITIIISSTSIIIYIYIVPTLGCDMHTHAPAKEGFISVIT